MIVISFNNTKYCFRGIFDRHNSTFCQKRCRIFFRNVQNVESQFIAHPVISFHLCIFKQQRVKKDHNTDEHKVCGIC